MLRCDLTNKPKLMDKTLFIYMQMNGGEIGLMLTEKKEEEEILNCASCGSHGRRVTQL